MSPVDEGELNLLAVHAVVRLRVRDPDCRVVGRRLLTRLLQQIINTLQKIGYTLKVLEFDQFCRA